MLTDGRYRILALLRTHEYVAAADGDGDGADGGEEVKVRVGNVYPVTFATTLSSPAGGKGEGNDEEGGDGNSTRATEDGEGGVDREGEAGDDGGDKGGEKKGILGMDGDAAHAWALLELEAARIWAVERKEKGGGKGKRRGGKGKKAGGDNKQDGSMTLKALLLRPSSGVYHYGPSLIEHCVLHAGLRPDLWVSLSDVKHTAPPSVWSDLTTSLKEEGRRVIDDLATAEGSGYVLYRMKEGGGSGSGERGGPSVAHSDKVFEEFQPHLLLQHASSSRPHLRYPTFADAVDEYFSLIEGQRRALRADAAEAAAKDRLERVRRDQERRVLDLEDEMDVMRNAASLVKYHAVDVDRAIGVINSALDSGMDWEALADLVDVEQGRRNPVALLIKSLDLDNERMVLALSNDLSNDKGEDAPVVHVTISLEESAFGNARDMFAKYKSSKEKSQKTIEASTKALRAAEESARGQLEDAQRRKRMVLTNVPARRKHWFEKFHWFITSDDYLVLGGRDAQQNEQLVKRYLRPGDACECLMPFLLRVHYVCPPRTALEISPSSHVSPPTPWRISPFFLALTTQTCTPMCMALRPSSCGRRGGGYVRVRRRCYHCPTRR